MLTANQGTKPLELFRGGSAPRLYDHLIGVLRVRHYSPRTEEAYVHWIRRYIEFHQHQHPRKLAENDVNCFQTHLAVKEHVAASTQNQALSAILFLYEHVLEQPLDRIEGVVRARRPKRLPVVMTVDEVSRVLAHLNGDKWLIVMLLYGGGLRLLEALCLRVKDPCCGVVSRPPHRRVALLWGGLPTAPPTRSFAFGSRIWTSSAARSPFARERGT